MYKKFFQATAVLALAGSAVAAPAPQQTYVQVVTETAVHTVVVEAGSQPTPPPQPPVQPAPPAPSPEPYTTVVRVEAPSVPTQVPVQEPAPEPTTSQTYPVGAAYMTVVQEWRSKLGLGTLTHDDTLTKNAQKTVDDGHGEMKHELNSGSMAQVLAQGADDAFERVFGGGWLCERPTLAGLSNACGSQLADGWDHAGQTGHADILTASDYKKIGCAFSQGIWGCDLA